MPLLVVLGAPLGVGARRWDPIRIGLRVGVALVVCLFALDLEFARASVHGAG